VSKATVSKYLLRTLGLGIVLTAGSLFGQTPPPALAFEVASIKPSEPVTQAMVAAGKLHLGMKIDGARVDIGNFALMQLICKAYDVKTYQVTGPSWLLTGQRFDIIGTLPPGATKEQVPQMLQTLLAERFKLTIHRDAKDQSVYALVVGKGGIKMKPAEVPVSADGAEANPAVSGSNSVSVKQTESGAVISDGQGRSQKMSRSPDGKSIRLEASKLNMAELAEGLSPFADKPVVDMTDLKGDFQVTIEISMQDMLNAAKAAGAALPPEVEGKAGEASDPSGSLFTAVQALGLKLEPRKAPLAMIVVDRVEKMPTEN
jgi:uncharacterized protein (TIGR03435 family)